jgi:putative membrane protein
MGDSRSLLWRGHEGATGRTHGCAKLADDRSGAISMIGGPFILLFALIGVIAIIVWIVRWATDSRRSRTALDILNERFARGEIDRAEYEEKRDLIGDGA